jgi:hypothetical protein
MAEMAAACTRAVRDRFKPAGDNSGATFAETALAAGGASNRVTVAGAAAE